MNLIFFSLSRQRSRAECIESCIHEASVHVNHPQVATICQCENTHDNRKKKTRQKSQESSDNAGESVRTFTIAMQRQRDDTKTYIDKREERPSSYG